MKTLLALPISTIASLPLREQYKYAYYVYRTSGGQNIGALFPLDGRAVWSALKSYHLRRVDKYATLEGGNA